MLLIDAIQIKQYFLEHVKLDGLKLSDLSEELRSDKEIVLAAIEQNPYAIQFASQKLRDDEEVVEAALKKRSSIYSSIPNPGGNSVLNMLLHELRVILISYSLG